MLTAKFATLIESLTILMAKTATFIATLIMLIATLATLMTSPAKLIANLSMFVVMLAMFIANLTLCIKIVYFNTFLVNIGNIFCRKKITNYYFTAPYKNIYFKIFVFYKPYFYIYFINNLNMSNPYLPADDFGKLGFMHNYASKLPTYAALFGISASALQQVIDDATNFDLGLKAVSAFQSFSKTVVSFKNFLRDGTTNATEIVNPPEEPAMPAFTATVMGNIFGRWAKQIQTIKAHPNFTETIGKDLGIIGTDRPPVDPTTIKPVLGHTILAGKPNISWKKQGHQGVHIYIDRSDGKGYGAMPFTDTKPDFLDEYPLPASGQTAIWKYKAIYIEDDVEIGNMSNELVVNVAGII